MQDLSLLGPVTLTGSDGTPIHSVLKQPKRIAFLAFLATAPSGTRTREEVLDLFWPEADREKARHALSQAMYYVRRSLGKDVIRNEGELLALNPHVVRTDVSTFLEALDDGRPADALDVYRGDLLQGFVFDDAPDFDRWLDGARERLRQKALQATTALSRQAEAGGDLSSAIAWAERGVSLSPFHEAPLRRLLSVLVAAAEPVRAKETLHRFQERLKEELDMEPSPETLEIVRTPRAATVDPGPSPVNTPGHAALDVAADAGVSPRPIPTEPLTPVEGPPRPPGPRWRAWRWAAAAGALVVVVAGLTDRIGRPGGVLPATAVTGAKHRVGVFPFMYRGRPDLAYLADGLPELLSISVGGLQGVSTVDPRALSRSLPPDESASWTQEARKVARRYGADQFVIGSVLEVGGQIQVTVQLYDTEGQRVVAASERAEREVDLFHLVDDLVRRLVASEAFSNSSQLEQAAALTTNSLPALRHFLEGERMFRAGLFQDATRAFDEATREDATFALAFYRGAVASLWSEHSDFDAARMKLARAQSYRSRVSELEGLLFDALHEFLAGHLFRAEVLYESVLARQPENLEAWFQLAEARFHYGALLGREAAASEDAWRKVLTIAPDHRAALIHLSAIAAWKGDPGLDSLETHLTFLSGDSVPVPQIRALRVFSTGSMDEDAFLDDLRRQPSEVVASTASYVARFLRDLDAAARIAGVLTVEARPPQDRAEGYLLLANLDVGRGRLDAADRALRAATGLDPTAAHLHRLLLAAVPSVPLRRQDGHGGGADLEVMLALPGGPSPTSPNRFDGSVCSGLVTYGEALAYARAGGEDGALLSAARTLSEDADPESTSFLQVLAHALAAQRRLDRKEDVAARDELSTG
ncbi:MAG TPA: BTAD domain-containing putative transcriptional regulator, partial [Longimicrobiales bacterium]|nr:BTAD domain-containing putative transcriptional regulator [Longimicrobiales bacterium]